jgi:hypothetical protein
VKREIRFRLEETIRGEVYLTPVFVVTLPDVELNGATAAGAFGGMSGILSRAGKYLDDVFKAHDGTHAEVKLDKDGGVVETALIPPDASSL